MNTEIISAASSTILSLLIILGLLVICAYFAKRFLRYQNGNKKASGTMLISILCSRSLGAQQNLVVAEANGQIFLLGVSRNGITLISRLEHCE